MRVGYWMCDSPCVTCENKGCGAYHDKCEKFKEFRAKADEVRKIKHQSVENRIAIRDMINSMQRKQGRR